MLLHNSFIGTDITSSAFPPSTDATTDSMTSTEAAIDTTTPNTTVGTTVASSTGSSSMTTLPVPEQSSFPAAAVGSLVGVVIFLLILLLIGGVVAMGCFMQTRRKIYRTEAENLRNVVLETNVNGTDKELITEETLGHENYHYQKTQFELKSRSQSSPAAPTGGVMGVSYSTLEGGGGKGGGESL